MSEIGFAVCPLDAFAGMVLVGDHVGRRLDPRGFRANLYFDDAAQWSELNWVGRTFRAG